MFSHENNIIIHRGVGIPGYGKNIVDDINYTEKRYLSIFIITIQLTNTGKKIPKWSCIHQQKLQTSVL